MKKLLLFQPNINIIVKEKYLFFWLIYYLYITYFLPILLLNKQKKIILNVPNNYLFENNRINDNYYETKISK